MHEVTLLWALRSPCDLGCRYCYFGTIEEHRLAMPDQPGQLSHLAHTDLSVTEITGFLSTVGDSAIRRVFLAGGEPLIWPHTLAVIETLTAVGVEVIVCTNGIPLNRPEITGRLLVAGVAAVSVSLDSADPAVNDTYRPARNRRDGWYTVVSGIRTLMAARGSATTPKIGIYTVVSRSILAGLEEMAQFAASLGVDYFVPQPISLDPDHALHDELALRPEDASAIRDALEKLYRAGPLISLPAPSYPGQVAVTISTSGTGMVHSCFGGHTLAFIEPDGSVWDCPSSHKIAATPTGRHRSIRHATASELFPATPTTCAADCAMFSRDCVNMWPLMDFTRFLHPKRVEAP
jgi:MoaA/NifB/PqqE/SkfB family radical SAM enzyme